MFSRAVNLLSLARRQNTKHWAWNGPRLRITIPSRRLWVVLAVLAFGLTSLIGERFVATEGVTLYGCTGWAKGLHFSPDGHKLFVSSYSTVAHWELGSGVGLPKGLLDVGGYSAITRDGSIVALEHSDGTVKLHDGFTDRSRAILQPPGALTAMSFCRDGSTLAVAGSEGVRLWDTTSGRLGGELRFDHSWATCVEFGPDGRTLAVGGSDGEIRLFEPGTWRQRLAIRAHSGPVNILAFTDDGRMLASLSKGNGVGLWDAKTGRPHPRLANIPGDACSMALAPTGTAVAMGYFDGPVRVRDTHKGVVRATLAAKDGPASALAFSPDGRTLACGGFQTVRLWTLPDD
jgi:WD40 repeat protein